VDHTTPATIQLLFRAREAAAELRPGVFVVITPSFRDQLTDLAAVSHIGDERGANLVVTGAAFTTDPVQDELTGREIKTLEQIYLCSAPAKGPASR
jgi:acyl-CoA reductase-like NAD-dependent aldehyde dehydrogenase